MLIILYLLVGLLAAMISHRTGGFDNQLNPEHGAMLLTVLWGLVLPMYLVCLFFEYNSKGAE